MFRGISREVRNEFKFRNVGILKITGKDFEILKIQLRTCRPFVMREVSLQENNLDASNGKQINSFLNQKVEE
jgi:hypothetical protein